jgi:hypothetical protein
MQIWKYLLAIVDQQMLDLPFGARILTVQAQQDKLCLWALVDEMENLLEPHQLAIYGTGPPLPVQPGIYIATVQTLGGRGIWHVFEMVDHVTL